MDAILISGPAAGVPFEMSDLRTAKEAAPTTPVIANTGVRADRIAEIFAVADGAIVGTSLKVDGVTWNPVDRDRAMRLMDAVRAVRARAGRRAEPAMARKTRVYFATDLHGSSKCFRKFVNAGDGLRGRRPGPRG